MTNFIIGRSFTISFSDYDQALNILSSSKYTSITLHHCIKPLPSPVVHLLKQTVTALTFSSMTSFTNIRLCLQNLPRIKILSFKDVLIDNKYSLPITSKQYESPSLKWLNFEHKLEEANNDVFLLQFFTTSVSMPNLEALTFMEDDDFETDRSKSVIPAAPSVSRIFEEEFSNSRTSLHSNQTSLPRSSVDYELESEAKLSVLARFLHENFDKIRTLRIRDHSIHIGNPIGMHVDNISYILLKLEEFVYCMDDPGQNFILTCQKNLNTLVGCGLIYEFNLDKFDTFFYAVDHNYKNLTEVRLCPYIVLSNETSMSCTTAEDKLPSILVDCKTFQKCHNLSVVEIDIRILASRSVPPETSGNNANQNVGVSIQKTGILNNIHHLPTSIQELVLSGSILCSKEMDLLFLRLPDFFHLENLSIELGRHDEGSQNAGTDIDDDEDDENAGGSTAGEFQFRKEWLKVLAKLSTKRLSMARFSGCSAQTQDLEQMQTYANFKGFIMERKFRCKALCLTFRF